MTEPLDALFVLRGRPGLGHVSPGLALARGLASHGVKVGVLSYGPGSAYLDRVRDFPFVPYRIDVPADYGEWAGLAIYDGGVGLLAPLIERSRARLVVLGGEYVVPPAISDPGLHLSLLFNPEIMAAGDRNQRAARVFSRLFSYCDSLVPLHAPVAEDEVLKDFLPLQAKLLGRGPFPAVQRRPGPPHGGRAGRTLLIANGGGTAFPGITSSYSAGAHLASVWLEQTKQFTARAITAACAIAGHDDEIRVFSGLPAAMNDAMRHDHASDRRVAISEVSPDYYDALHRAHVIVSRAGLGFINDLPLTTAGIVLWALEGHDEQVHNARGVAGARPNAVYVERTDQLPSAIEDMIARDPFDDGARSRLHHNLQRVVAAYLEILGAAPCS